MGSDAAQRPRRVLMTADALGGVWPYTVDLCAGLSRAGVEVLVATLGTAPSADQAGSINNLAGVRAVHGNYRLEWMQNPWQDVEDSGKWLLDLQADFDADVIHLNGFSHAALKWGRPTVCVGHSCVRSWWHAVHGVEPGPDWAEYSHRVKDGLEASTVVVAPSRAMAHSLHQEYGTAAGKIRVIYNSTRIPEYSGKQKEAFVLSAGRMWDSAKNLGLLTEIAAGLDWPVKIAGATAGITVQTDHLTILGSLPHGKLLEQMRHASIFAHPALYEPFGLAVLEAAHARCCLVLSKIPSLRELWDGAALFLDPRDPELWIFEVNELCRDFPRRQRLAELAAKRARRYNSETMMDEYLELYSSLMSADDKVAAA